MLTLWQQREELQAQIVNAEAEAAQEKTKIRTLTIERHL